MKNNTTLVFGYFGFSNNQLDGQTVKTRNIFYLLKSQERTIGRICFFDSQRFQKSVYSFFVLFYKIMRSRTIVYIPAHNNLKFLFPFLFFYSKIFRINIVYIVVGGWLIEFLQNNPFHKLLLRYIYVIMPQTPSMVTSLTNIYNFRNITLLPNFRINNYIPKFRKPNKDFRVVFMARINIKKGVDTVFRIAEYFLDNPIGPRGVVFDFWGPVNHDDNEFFFSEIKKYPNTFYRGQLNPEDIHTTISQYDLLILPTKYFTEGFPGSVLDAYISGIPVIVTKWKYATEFVENGKTGYIVPFTDGEQDIIKSITKLYNNPYLLEEMKKNAFNKSKYYGAEYAWSILKVYL